MAVEIGSEKLLADNIGDLNLLFKSEGLEILAMEFRNLDIEEAFYIKCRKMAVEDH